MRRSQLGRAWHIEEPLPLAKSLINNPEHWLYRAEEARANAKLVRDPDAKRIMLDLAAGYDLLADYTRVRRLDPGSD